MSNLTNYKIESLIINPLEYLKFTSEMGAKEKCKYFESFFNPPQEKNNWFLGYEFINTDKRIASKKLRIKILDRDGNSCKKCNSKINLQIDHKKPFSKGGKTEEKNLQVLCSICNKKKGAKYE